MNRRARFWLPAALWSLLIFVLSSIPGAAFPSSPLLSYDKLVHATVYAVLGAFCFWALWHRSDKKTSTLVVLSGAIATVYGMTDEFHQLFVQGRSADVRDVLADSVGGFVGAQVASMLFARAARDPAAKAQDSSVK
jgi:VanZ family protein